MLVLRFTFWLSVAGCDCDWIGCFGKHLSPVLFRQLRDFQKLNHFPGSFELGRKDLLTMNLSKMRARFGSEMYNFYPNTFILPREFARLKESWKQTTEPGSSRGKKRAAAAWIIKPVNKTKFFQIHFSLQVLEGSVYSWLLGCPKCRNAKSLSHKLTYMTRISLTEASLIYGCTFTWPVLILCVSTFTRMDLCDSLLKSAHSIC